LDNISPNLVQLGSRNSEAHWRLLNNKPQKWINH